MRRIFKYTLGVVDEQVIDTYSDWKPLSVQVQDDQVCLWAEIDDIKAPARNRVFMHGTGHSVHPAAQVFVGTFQDAVAQLVFHVYTEGRP